MKSWSRRCGGRYLARLAIGAAIVSLAATPVAAGSFSSGSTGADGAFNPTCTPTPCAVPVVVPASGVFNFTTVNIPVDVTVTPARNSSNTPVTILATGDVTIAGTIDVSGGNANGPLPGRGGPGGFDGGLGGSGVTTLSFNGTPGLGPGGGGGGNAAVPEEASGGGGGFGTAGSGPASQGGSTYGAHTLFPLLGGSGGGGSAGSASSNGSGGGGGAGAILIASSGTITLTGRIVASGGLWSFLFAGCGSGGGIRLIANGIAGTGEIIAEGGPRSQFTTFRTPCFDAFIVQGGEGRIRLETFQDSFTGGTVPIASRGIPGAVTPAPGFPTLRIAAVGGVAAPANPQATFLATPDITLSPAVINPVAVNLTATNIPIGTFMAVSVVTEGVATRTTVNSTPLTGTLAASTATANVTLQNGTSVISASATFATTTAGLEAPMMIAGEEVKWIRVAASYGAKSTVTYITESGREIAAK